ncbi:diadenosine tetraphosphate (Ap4A) HIT family hydrolase [Breoghania corrubedonensis]|uniref:Diadenosine tetraphosphate (Ap4A) HIT family hydrolase n=1 Tax=Breoghania corrubedonensis TaxID=665038 RepID=A0A2T5VH30_9HYPH|nr:HIT domain-containing protein [Breoghania corrubedonensis]PTW63060.1 diadenosine tetraphosphate (Ap4A) HIT family hydrolase [Breoghania corrubedonensis]
MSDAFSLDPRLEADSLSLTDMPLSHVRLMNDARFPWLVLIPRKADLEELTDLEAGERTLLMEEIAHASKVLQLATDCDKLNVGALGNVVRQLHIHVVARFENDAAWDGPVWGAGERVPYTSEAGERMCGDLIERLRVRSR